MSIGVVYEAKNDLKDQLLYYDSNSVLPFYDGLYPIVIKKAFK